MKVLHPCTLVKTKLKKEDLGVSRPDRRSKSIPCKIHTQKTKSSSNVKRYAQNAVARKQGHRSGIVAIYCLPI